jgi:hypothetical protein
MRGISASVLAKHLLYAQQSDLLDRPLWPCPVLPAFAVVLSVGAGSRAGTLAWRPARLLRPCVPVSCLSAQASGTLGRKRAFNQTHKQGADPVQSKGHGRQVLHDVVSHGGYLLHKIRSAFPCPNCPQHEVCPACSRINLGIQNQGLNPDIGVRLKKMYVLRNDTLILLGFLYPRTSMCQLAPCLALNPKPDSHANSCVIGTAEINTHNPLPSMRPRGRCLTPAHPLICQPLPLPSSHPQHSTHATSRSFPSPFPGETMSMMGGCVNYNKLCIVNTKVTAW